MFFGADNKWINRHLWLVENVEMFIGRAPIYMRGNLRRPSFWINRHLWLVENVEMFIWRAPFYMRGNLRRPSFWINRHLWLVENVEMFIWRAPIYMRGNLRRPSFLNTISWSFWLHWKVSTFLRLVPFMQVVADQDQTAQSVEPDLRSNRKVNCVGYSYFRRQMRSSSPLSHSTAFWPRNAIQLRKTFWKKGEIAYNKQFLRFSQCFLPCMVLIFYFKCTLKCRL